MAKTVLIIEDDEDTRAIFGAILSERGYEILTASQGAEGVHLARTRRPDLILLDIRMPVMDGWIAIRYLKSYGETLKIPVCAISAFEPDEQELEEVGGMPFDCFLMKPIDPNKVVAEIISRVGPAEDTSPPDLPQAQ